jgi:hypothetical protein
LLAMTTMLRKLQQKLIVCKKSFEFFILEIRLKLIIKDKFIIFQAKSIKSVLIGLTKWLGMVM